MIDEHFTIVKEENFIKATRDSGYKSTASAISELADNGFQAGANSFDVFFLSEEQKQVGRGRPKMPVVLEVVCVDDGSGMSPDVLRTALRFGGTTRFNDRSGFGRFGMGLPNSSVSQCRRVEVFTWKDKSEVYSCYIDIDEIASGKMLVVPEPRRIAVPEEYQSFVSTSSGTIVVWKNCDRLDYYGREETLARELPKTLGQTYRYYLARGKAIRIGGRDIKPFDPLFLMPEAEFSGAIQHGAPLTFSLSVPGNSGEKASVDVRFSLLPEEWQATIGKRKKESRERGIDRSRGFSIVRAGRELDFGYFRMRGRHWTDSWWSCEISFDPALDELFGVTHTKQQVKLNERVRTTIEKDINANIATLADIIVSRGKKRHAKNTRKAEDIAKDSEKFLRVSPEIRDKPLDVVEKEIREYVEQSGTDERPLEDVIEDLRDRPFLMDFENLPGAPFYRVRTFGKTTVVTLNRDHTFFERLYQPLCDHAPASKTAIELLLFALAKSETVASDEGVLWYKTQRHEWSRVLSVYLDGLQSTDELVE
jgi:Histidine kinase-, DNA gyrase B-, and HSP90-like ATPase